MDLTTEFQDYIKIFTKADVDNLKERETMQKCLKYGGFDNRYYCGLRCLYGIGMDQDLELAEQLLCRTEEAHDIQGLTNIYPEIDFWVWRQEIFIDDGLAHEEENDNGFNRTKIALSYLRLFKKSDLRTIIKEIYYQQKIGIIGVEEVKNQIDFKYDKEDINVNFNPLKAFELLSELDIDCDWSAFNGLGTYLKAHCLEQGIGTSKDIEAAVKVYLACVETSIHRRCGYLIYPAFYKIVELTNKYFIKLPELEDFPYDLRHVWLNTARTISINEYCKNFDDKKRQALLNRKKLYPCDLVEYTERLCWPKLSCPENELEHVSDRNKALAQRILNSNILNVKLFTDEENPPIHDYEDDMGIELTGGIFPSNVSIAVEFFCPLQVGKSSALDFHWKPDMLDRIKSPLGYLQFLFERNVDLEFFPRRLRKSLKTFIGDKGRLIIKNKYLLDEYGLEEEFYQDDVYDDLIEEDLEAGIVTQNMSTYTPSKYECIGDGIDFKKNENCHCEFAVCPFKLAALIKFCPNFKVMKENWKARKYNFDIPFDKLDIFNLSDQDIKNAKSLAEEDLVYFSSDGMEVVFYFTDLCSENWENLNENISFESHRRKFTPISDKDSYGEKIIKAAAIWSYLVAKNISLKNLQNIVRGGLNRAVKVLQKQDIDYYYGAIMGDMDTCDDCCNYIREKVSEKYEIESKTLFEFCENSDSCFDKILGFSDSLYNGKSSSETHFDVEPMAVLGDSFTPGSILNLVMPLNSSENSEKITKRTLYIISDLYYRPDKKKIDDVNAFQRAIELLGNIMRSKYVFLCGSREEVDGILNLDVRLERLFRENIIELSNDVYWEDEFENFINSLPQEFLRTHKFSESKLKRQFCSLYQNNKFPFKNSELKLYLRNYCIVNDCLEIPYFSSADDIEKEWEELIGLDNVKSQIERIENMVMYNQRAKMDGKLTISSNRHMMFLGSPGVGKTKVARLMAKKLFSIGAISKETIVEVDRKDLVAEHVGQTAIKTAEVIKKADGGVLFVDEAYSLCGNSNDFGSEAIATLIKAMEDRKDSLIVVFAGYKDEMEKKFIPMNPGIESRIRFKLVFEDYKIKELVTMFFKKIEKQGHTCKDKDNIVKIVSAIFEKASNQENFGFGRYVEKFYDETMMNHATRVLSEDFQGDFYDITMEDIKEL